MFVPLLPSDRGLSACAQRRCQNLRKSRRFAACLSGPSNAESAQSTEDALNLLRNPTFDPAQSAVVTGLPAIHAQPNPQDSVEIISYQAERVELRAKSAEQALLLLSDAYYPGWRATVDGVESPIYPANHLFRGLALAAGEHTIVFEFDPSPWRRGLQLSGLGIVLWLVLLLSGLWKRQNVPVTGVR